MQRKTDCGVFSLTGYFYNTTPPPKVPRTLWKKE